MNQLNKILQEVFNTYLVRHVPIKNDSRCRTQIMFEEMVQKISELEPYNSGLTDKTGAPITNGCYVKFYYKGEWRYCQVVFNWGMFCLRWPDGYINKYPLVPENLQVVSNKIIEELNIKFLNT